MLEICGLHACGLWFICLWFVVYMLAQALDAELDDGADKWEALERCAC